jgi:hypothetical protein
MMNRIKRLCYIVDVLEANVCGDYRFGAKVPNCNLNEQACFINEIVETLLECDDSSENHAVKEYICHGDRLPDEICDLLDCYCKFRNFIIANTLKSSCRKHEYARSCEAARVRELFNVLGNDKNAINESDELMQGSNYEINNHKWSSRFVLIDKTPFHDTYLNGFVDAASGRFKRVARLSDAFLNLCDGVDINLFTPCKRKQCDKFFVKHKKNREFCCNACGAMQYSQDNARADPDTPRGRSYQAHKKKVRERKGSKTKKSFA